MNCIRDRESFLVPTWLSEPQLRSIRVGEMLGIFLCGFFASLDHLDCNTPLALADNELRAHIGKKWGSMNW